MGKDKQFFLSFPWFPWETTSIHLLSVALRGSPCTNVPPLGQWGLPTFPWATSSLWAAEADLTRALVAAAMDLAASKICSSKSRVSSACCKQTKTVSHTIHPHKGHFLPNYLLLGHPALRPSVAFCGQTTPGVKRPTLAGRLSFGCLPLPPTLKGTSCHTDIQFYYKSGNSKTVFPH